MSYHKPHSKRLSFVLRALVYLPLALLLFGIAQTPGLSNLQASGSSPDALTAGAYAYPLATTTPTITITPTSTPLPCGLAWNVIDSLSPGSTTNSLFGVAAVSPNDVWAVGGSDVDPSLPSMIQHWDGTQWSIVLSPNPGTSTNLLLGVKAVSANDVWAVGYYSSSGPSRTLVEHWDGTQWSVIPSPNSGTTTDNTLRQLAVISANDIWAVGEYNNSIGYANPLTEHWDGTQWSIVPSPSPGPNQTISYLYGVSAISTNDIWAVGFYNAPGGQHTFTIHWDGVQWSIVPSPNAGTFYNDNVLMGVTAVTTNDVWAVGYYIGDTDGVQTLVLHWTGVEWTVAPSPNATTHGNYLYTVDTDTANGANDIWAVGYDLNGTRGETLVLHWDGVQWSIALSPSPGGYHNQLNRVAVLSNHDVWAVGYKRNCFSGCSWETLVEHYSDPCALSSPTPTPTGTAVLVGHVTWQGRLSQPNALQQLPITLTLRSGSNEINYLQQTTDARGFFTVTAPSYPNNYQWRAKGPKYLANAGSLGLQVGRWKSWEVQTTQVEMGLMRVGDANSDNLVNASDFNIVKRTFGRSSGQQDYDDRADFNGDQLVNIIDFNLMKVNFGLAGAPPLNP